MDRRFFYFEENHSLSEITFFNVDLDMFETLLRHKDNEMIESMEVASGYSTGLGMDGNRAMVEMTMDMIKVTMKNGFQTDQLLLLLGLPVL